MHQQGQPAEALKLIARALKSNARSAPAHSNYAIVLAALERHEEALKSYERAIALKPDYAEAFNNRGNTLRSLKRAEEALLNYEQAIAIRPDYPEAITAATPWSNWSAWRTRWRVTSGCSYAVLSPTP